MRKETDLSRRDERETCFRDICEKDIKYDREKRTEL